MKGKIKTSNGKKYLVTETELITNHLGEVNWLINFVSGGWNSVFANTEIKALAKAQKEYDTKTTIKVANVKPMTHEMEKRLLANFN